jgi:hypothetical protein
VFASAVLTATEQAGRLAADLADLRTDWEDRLWSVPEKVEA